MPLPIERSAATTVWSSSHRMSKSPPPVLPKLGRILVNVRPPSVERHSAAGWLLPWADPPRPSTSTVLPSGLIETFGSPPPPGKIVSTKRSWELDDGQFRTVTGVAAPAAGPSAGAPIRTNAAHARGSAAQPPRGEAP